MKYRISLAIFLCMFAISSGDSQVCDFSDDYSDPAPWNFEYVYPGAGGCGDDPQTGTLTVAGGIVNYDNINDANDTRIWRDIGTPVSDETWTATFEFTPTAIGMAGIPRVGHVIWALTSGTNCPFNDSWEHCIANDQDGIMIWYLSEYSPSDPTTGFYIYAKNELVYVNTAVGDNITALPGQTYYLTFKRLSANYVSLEVYLDEARTDLLDAIECFEIPDDITNLHYLQHGNAPWGYYMRVLTGTLDNTCIVNEVITSNTLTGPESVCAGEDAEYSVSGTTDVDWDIPVGVDYVAVDDNTITITDWGGAGTYTITAEVTGTCAPIILSMDVEVNPSYETDSTIAMCEGDTIYVYGIEVTSAGSFEQTFSTAAGCDSVLTIYVEIADTLYTEETYTICLGDSVYVNGTYMSSPGSFTESFVSSGGCDSLHTVTIIVNDMPNVYFTSDTILCPINGVTITPIYSGPDLSVVWSPGTGLSCTTCYTPFAIPTESGWYAVTVTTTDGCVYTDSVYILLNISDWGIPNAFSPNGDGINDYFGPILTPDCQLEYFVIYNRWGAEIFHSKSTGYTWDGNYNGIPQEIGAYVYIVSANCSGAPILKSGSLTLVR